MKCVVLAEVWIEVEAENQERGFLAGMEVLGEGLRLIEKKGGQWSVLKTDEIDDEVPWGA
ncbi:MAG: hypothetical protein AAB152_18845 [Candidatus Coatesbacteria bacterium]